MDIGDFIKLVFTPATILAIGTAIAYVINAIGKLKQQIAVNTTITTNAEQAAKEAANVAAAKAEEVNMNLNGRLTQMIESAKEAGYAEGMANGVSITMSGQIKENSAKIIEHGSRLDRIEGGLYDILKKLDMMAASPK